ALGLRVALTLREPRRSGTRLDGSRLFQQLCRLGVPRSQRQGALGLGVRGRAVLLEQIGLAERFVGFGRLLAPQRDLERLDGVARPPRPKMQPADEQVRLGLVRRQVDRAPKLRERGAILLALEKPASAIEMERRHLALLALRGPPQRRAGAPRLWTLEEERDALESLGH